MPRVNNISRTMTWGNTEGFARVAMLGNDAVAPPVPDMDDYYTLKPASPVSLR